MSALAKKQSELQSLFKKQEEAYKAIGEAMPTADQKQEIATINEAITKINEEVSFLNQKQADDEARQKFADGLKVDGRPDQPGNGSGGEQRKSIIEEAMSNDEFRAYREKGAQGEFKGMSIAGAKTLVTGALATSAGALVINDRKPITDGGAIKSQISVLDLITVDSTGSDLVEFVKVTSLTNNAAETAEREADGTPSGSAPESAMAMEVVQLNVQTIKHFIPVTRQALSDASQTEGIIRDLLGYGLRSRLASQVLVGDGNAPNLEGITNVTGIQTQAYSASIHETLRKAMTKVYTNAGDAMPSAILLNPADFEALQLARDSEDRYLFGGPVGAGVATCWGLPIASDSRVTAGKAYVADWRLARLWLRENVNIRTSESHGTYFVEDVIAILAQMRAAFGLIRPAAFVEATVVAP